MHVDMHDDSPVTDYQEIFIHIKTVMCALLDKR